MDGQRIPVVIVGGGSGVAHRHVACAKAHPRTEVAAVIDPREDGRRPWAGDYPVFESLDAMLKAGVVAQIGVVCTPDWTHADVFAELVELGCRAVLVEKPLAATPEQARAIVALARERGVAVFHGTQRGLLHRPIAELFRGCVAHTLTHVWRRDGEIPRGRSTGVLADLVPHALSELWTLQPPRSPGVVFAAAHGDGSIEDDDATVLVRFAERVRWEIHASYTSLRPRGEVLADGPADEITINAVGVDGELWIPGPSVHSAVEAADPARGGLAWRRGEPREGIALEPLPSVGEAHERLFAELVKHRLGGFRVTPNAVWIVAVIEAAYASARSGRAVEVPGTALR